MLSTPRLVVALRTLAISAAGGALFEVLGMPAGWLSGGVIAAGVATIARVDTRMPAGFVTATLLFLGTSLGAGASPEIVHRMADWPISIAFLLVALALLQSVVQLFFRRVAGWDRETAFFAAVPGVMSFVLALSAATRADMQKVVMAQVLRVFLLSALTPGLLGLIEPSATLAARSPVVASPVDILFSLLAGAAGAGLFRLARVPTAPLLGGLAGSTLLHVSGLASGTFPPLLLVLGFVSLGAVAGTRLSTADVMTLHRTALMAALGFVVAVAVAALCAWGVASLTGLPFDQMALAYAPGGMDVTMTLAFALGLDVTFVAVHQFLRFVAVAIAMPIASRSMLKRGTDEA